MDDIFGPLVAAQGQADASIGDLLQLRQGFLDPANEYYRASETGLRKEPVTPGTGEGSGDGGGPGWGIS